MNIGEKIKQLRKEQGLSQEQLAEKLIVSRAAVAKWESGIGLPDIENLKRLSAVLGVSIDKLVGDVQGGAEEAGRSRENAAGQVSNEAYYASFIGKKCTVDMKDWNDGIFDSYVLTQDEEFLYYVTFEKKATMLGALAKRYISRVKESAKKETETVELSKFKGLNREYFRNRTANIYLEDKRFLSGIFGEDTELLDVGILEITDTVVRLATGMELEIGRVTKIEQVIGRRNG